MIGGSSPGRGWGFFFSPLHPETALGPTQPLIRRVTGAVSLGVKWPGREADHSPSSTAEVETAWSYTSTLPIRLHGVVLVKAQGCRSAINEK
jgi:hypothetical protein